MLCAQIYLARNTQRTCTGVTLGCVLKPHACLCLQEAAPRPKCIVCLCLCLTSFVSARFMPRHNVPNMHLGIVYVWLWPGTPLSFKKCCFGAPLNVWCPPSFTFILISHCGSLWVVYNIPYIILTSLLLVAAPTGAAVLCQDGVHAAQRPAHPDPRGHAHGPGCDRAHRHKAAQVLRVWRHHVRTPSAAASLCALLSLGVHASV